MAIHLAPALPLVLGSLIHGIGVIATVAGGVGMLVGRQEATAGER